jgi:hypothetical protein
MVKKSKIRIRDEHSGSYFRELRKKILNKKYLNSCMRIRIRDPESFDPGWKSRIRDKHPGSAALLVGEASLVILPL